MPVTALFALEARRQSRRPGTWALRLGYPLVLAVVIGFVWALGAQEPHLQHGDLGHRLMVAYRRLVLLLAVGIAPALVARGAAADRTEGLLDLLRLTGMPSGQLVLGRVATRLVVLLTVVLAGVPVVSLTLALGGVGPWEVVNTTSNGLLLILALGGVAGLLGTASDRPWLSLVLAVTWGWLAFFVLPSVIEYALSAERFLGWGGQGFVPRWVERLRVYGFDLRPGTEVFSPVAAMRVDGARGLAPALASAAALVVVGFSTRSGGRSPSGGRAFGVVGLPLGVALVAVALRTGQDLAARMLLGGGGLLLLAAGTALYLDLALWLMRHAPRREAPWQWGLAGLWLAAMVAMWAAGATGDVPDPRPALLLVAVLLTAVAATRAFADEISQHTLPLLLASTMPRQTLLRRKFAVVAARTLPLTVLVLVLHAPLALPWGLMVWATLAFACMASTLRVGPTSLAWLVNLGAICLWSVGVAALGALRPGALWAVLPLAGTAPQILLHTLIAPSFLVLAWRAALAAARGPTRTA